VSARSCSLASTAADMPCGMAGSWLTCTDATYVGAVGKVAEVVQGSKVEKRQAEGDDGGTALTGQGCHWGAQVVLGQGHSIQQGLQQATDSEHCGYDAADNSMKTKLHLQGLSAGQIAVGRRCPRTAVQACRRPGRSTFSELQGSGQHCIAVIVTPL
jgi:hypothetical protein